MKTLTNPATLQTPLAELRQSLSDFAARCRAMNWLGALFRVGVAQDIVKDVEAQQAAIANDAYSAEQSDLEAVKIIEDAARDGLSQCDMPALAKALRLIKRSAERDHHITEAARL